MTTLVIEDMDRTCGLCGKRPAEGFAAASPDGGWGADGLERASLRGLGMVWLCRTDDESKPDCYHRWTVYGDRPKPRTTAP